MLQLPGRRGRALVLLSILSYFTTIAPAIAEDQENGGKIVAVQSRKYVLKHEFTGSGGILPLDAFAKGFTLGGSYTYHFDNFYGFELFDIHVAENVDTGLKEDLQNNFGVSTTAFNLANYLLVSNIVIKPVYGKLIFFNRKLLPGELSLVFGGGVVGFDDGILPAVDLGLIFRVWLSQAWSIRADFRDYVASDGETTENLLRIGLGFSWNVGGR